MKGKILTDLDIGHELWNIEDSLIQALDSYCQLDSPSIDEYGNITRVEMGEGFPIYLIDIISTSLSWLDLYPINYERRIQKHLTKYSSEF